jgi:hypothetical protein
VRAEVETNVPFLIFANLAKCGYIRFCAKHFNMSVLRKVKIFAHFHFFAKKIPQVYMLMAVFNVLVKILRKGQHLLIFASDFCANANLTFHKCENEFFSKSLL